MKIPAIIDKYLGQEFMKPFFITLFILVIILLSSFLFQLTDYIIIKEIPVRVVLQLLFYKLPEFIVRAISMAVLFATLLSLSRLVKDNEFTALRMGGISLFRVVIPLIVLGLLISGVSFLFNERVVPWANEKYQQVIRYSVNKEEDPNTREDLFFKDSKDRYFYLGKLNLKTHQIDNILIYDKGEEVDKFITAQKGSFQGKTLTFNQGIEHKLSADKYVKNQQQIKEQTLNFVQELTELYAKEKDPGEMNRRELKNRIKMLEISGIDTTKMRVEYHFKLAEPLACLIFVLLGAPLSVKSDKGRIFGVIASVVIIFIYYIFLSLSRSLGNNGVLSPLIAVWLPNLVFAAIGLGLIVNESR